MKIYEDGNSVVVEGLKDFNAKHIFECGQCFRWKLQEDGSYTGVVKGRVLNVKNCDDERVVFDNTKIEEFNNIWYDYFDLGTDYSNIKNILKNYDEHLNDATKFGWGIRILKQDGWEMLISFIISSNNRIPMIQRAIENLSKKYGKYIGNYRGEEYYSFPSPKELSSATIKDIRECKTGFRDKYIKKTTDTVFSGGHDVGNLSKLNTYECRNELLKFSGVGPKVCDCISLFGMQKYDTFPVDVWVKRVMQEFYLCEDLSLTKIRANAIERFRDMSGFAQQYLFYYARENGIGKGELVRS